MIHARSLGIGALVGVFASLTTMGFIACDKSDKNNAAKAAEKGAAALPAQSDKELGTPIAEVDGVVITLAEFQDRINKQSPYIRARYTSMERKKEFLDNLVRFEVLAAEAKKRGLDQDPEVVRTMKQVMIQKLMKTEFDTRVKPEDVTEVEMKKFYDEHTGEYNKPEEVRVAAIILKDKATADKVAKEAVTAGQDAKGFRDLVSKYSTDDVTKARGGDLRYFAVGSPEVPAEVVDAAFKLTQTGQIAGPIAGKDGKFYVIKQTGRRKALVKTFDEVKKQIQNRLYRDKRTTAMEDFVTGLKTKAKISVHDEALAKVRIDTSGAGDVEGDGHGGMPPSGPGAPGAEDDGHGHGAAPAVPAPAPKPAAPAPKPAAPAPAPTK